MIKYYIYALSGEGMNSGRSFELIILLKKAGAVFPLHPKFNNVNGQLLFYPVQPINEEIKERALTLLRAEGFTGADIKFLGSYVKW